MRKLGFSYQWISWITSLYKEVKTLVVVNGERGDAFTMEWYSPRGTWFQTCIWNRRIDFFEWQASMGSNFADDMKLFLKCFANN
jgi:hypothetical protein